jgi:hypothetical protein
MVIEEGRRAEILRINLSMKRLALSFPIALVLVACGAGSSKTQLAARPEQRVAAESVSTRSEAIETTALSDGACQTAGLCELSGLCSARGDECVAASDSECRASTQCATDGACSAQNDTCVATSDSECRASEACRKGRRCTAHKGYCVN